MTDVLGRRIVLNRVPHSTEPRSLFALAWTYAPGAKFAFDAITGGIVDVNPAAEALSGYSRQELLGVKIIQIHPDVERVRVKSEFLNPDPEQQLSRHSGYHLQRKDGQCIPVAISSSKSVVLDGRPTVISVYFDISEAEQSEHRLATQNWALYAYAGAALALGQADSYESLLTGICEAITRESVYLLAWVGFAEDGPGKPVRIVAEAGSATGYLEGLQVSWSEEQPEGRGPTGICIRTCQNYLVEDTEESAAFVPWRKRAAAFGMRSSLAIPFVVNGGRAGALMVYAAHPKAFEPVAIDVFQHLGEEIGHGLHAIEQQRLLSAERKRRAKIESQLTDALSAMVAPIVLAMEMRDPYTTGHQSRVAAIAYAIAKEMGWPEERLQGLRVAALVHDIGKISIPAEVLTKPTRLSHGEWEIIHGHPETGFTILKDIPFAWPVAEIVRQHHERLDGSGYPLGLKGDAIVPEAKVLAVADIVEAMSAFRPYRPGHELEAALLEIEKQAGSLLDPEVVKVCAALFRDKRFTLPSFSHS